MQNHPFIRIGSEDYRIEIGTGGLVIIDNRHKQSWLRSTLFHAKQVGRRLKRFMNP